MNDVTIHGPNKRTLNTEKYHVSVNFPGFWMEHDEM